MPFFGLNLWKVDICVVKSAQKKTNTSLQCTEESLCTSILLMASDVI